MSGKESYYIIIGIGLFIMFALLGYLVELSQKLKNKAIDEKKVDNINNTLINNSVIMDMTESGETSIDNDILNK